MQGHMTLGVDWDNRDHLEHAQNLIVGQLHWLTNTAIVCTGARHRNEVPLSIQLSSPRG